jgi:dihydrodipicolinate reductase
MVRLVIMKPKAKLIQVNVKDYSSEDKREANREPSISVAVSRGGKIPLPHSVMSVARTQTLNSP